MSKPIPFALPDGVFVETSDYYRRLWKEVEECSGKSRSIDSVRFYAARSNDSGFVFMGEPGYAGMALSDRGLVIIGYSWLAADSVLRHEMLHMVASPEGHDPIYFGYYLPDTVVRADTTHISGKLDRPGLCTHLVVCINCTMEHVIITRR